MITLSKKGKPNAVGVYQRPTVPWKRADTYMVSTEDEFNDLITECIMGRFREMKTKTSLSEWAGKSGYRIDESFDSRVLWKKTYLGEGESVYERFIFNKNPSKRNRKGGEGSRSFQMVKEKFEEEHGMTWKQNFGSLSYQKELWEDCCISPITYCNEDEDYKAHTLKGVRKCDVSSAYPSQANDFLPTYTGHKKVKGYAEPTEEYPFAFYIKSHHMAIYTELDTRDFLQRGKRVGYKNYNSEKKFDRWENEVPEEEEVTYLLKKAQYGLGDIYQEFYETKQAAIDQDEYDDAKMVLNSSLGFMGSHKFNRFNYCPYIYAVVKARHVNRMLDAMADIQGTILMVLTDSIIWLGDQYKGVTTAKTLGAFVDELQSDDTAIWYRNYGQYAISVGDKVKMVKTQGVEQTDDVMASIKALKTVGDLSWVLPMEKAEHFAKVVKEVKYSFFGGVYDEI